MAKFHLTQDGPRECRAKERPCPLGASPQEHYPDFHTARKVYEHLQASQHGALATLAKAPAVPGARQKGARQKAGTVPYLRDRLQKNLEGVMPPEAIESLAIAVDNSGKIPLAIVQSGSELYGTKLPGPTHDYDFIAFSAPMPGFKTARQSFHGDVDLLTVPMDHMQTIAPTSTPITEAFFGARAGAGVFYTEDNAWGPYMNSYRPSIQQYMKLLNSAQRSHSFQEPAFAPDDPEDTKGKANFRNFKHSLRWSLYSQRWGDGQGDDYNFDPRLTEAEKEQFFAALKEGRIPDHLKVYRDDLLQMDKERAELKEERAALIQVEAALTERYQALVTRNPRDKEGLKELRDVRRLRENAQNRLRGIANRLGELHDR